MCLTQNTALLQKKNIILILQNTNWLIISHYQLFLSSFAVWCHTVDDKQAAESTEQSCTRCLWRRLAQIQHGWSTPRSSLATSTQPGNLQSGDTVLPNVQKRPTAANRLTFLCHYTYHLVTWDQHPWSGCLNLRLDSLLVKDVSLTMPPVSGTPSRWLSDLRTA